METQDFARVSAELGRVLGGFYLDDGAYGPLAQAASDWGEAEMPGNFDLVMKVYRLGDPSRVLDDIASFAYTCYVND